MALLLSFFIEEDDSVDLDDGAFISDRKLLPTYSIPGAADLSLNSWLQCLPEAAFTQPFESCQLNLSIHRLQKPPREAGGLWADQVLLEPLVKPLIFPCITNLPSANSASHMQTSFQNLMRSVTTAGNGGVGGRAALVQSLLQQHGRSRNLLGMATSSLVSRTGVGFSFCSSQPLAYLCFVD